jgi:hypothetical protein
MARRFGAQTEIARRFHQAGAEVMLPDAIYHHACRERVVSTGDGTGQFEPAAALTERLALRTREHSEELPRHFVAKSRRAAAIEHAWIRLRFAVGKSERGRRA